MSTLKRKSINNAGLIVSIVAGMIIFGNGMGAAIWAIIIKPDLSGQTYCFAENPLEYIFANFTTVAISMVFFGVLLLIGGISIRKYKKWTNILVSALSEVFILIMALMAYSFYYTLSGIPETELFGKVMPIITMLFSIPPIILIRFLNRKEIKKHFS